MLGMWSFNKLPGYWRGMNPALQRAIQERSVYEAAIAADPASQGLAEERMQARVLELLGSQEQAVSAASLPAWLQASRTDAEKAGQDAADDAKVARFVFLGIVVFFILLIVLTDLACRNRIGRGIREAEAAGAGSEAWS